MSLPPNNDNQPTTNYAPLFAFLAVIIPTLFDYFARTGWIAFLLTPANAADMANATLDFLRTVVPPAAALFAAWKLTRKQQIKSTNALPGVLGVAVTPALDAKLPELPTVTTPEKLIEEIRKAA